MTTIYQVGRAAAALRGYREKPGTREPKKAAWSKTKRLLPSMDTPREGRPPKERNEPRP